ncbi:LysR family transcriptional regulator [uncultured Shewanella sp.]|uniref:LysR family transcriptional regulator n=1 Tax=Shewanella atlantica TaxID=271099 RepID=UPI00262A988D|nr:LysR family transcriptional regulator [uncultured Shewanella sp.]
MDLRVISYFIDIVDSGGFARASEKIHITQPALSKAIIGLEHELDLVLIERGKRGTQLKLTSAGEVVYRHGIELLDARHRMLNELASQRDLTSGELRLGLAPLGSSELFAPVIAKFKDSYPKIEMSLFVRGGVEQTLALQKGEIELATGIVSFDKEFDGIRIHEDPMVVVLPKNHTLADEASLQLCQISDIAQIMFEHDFALYGQVFDACEKAGFTPKNITRVSHPDFGIALVAAGAGTMVLPKLIAERHSVSGVVHVPLKSSELYWELSLYWQKGKQLSFAAQAMLNMVKERFTNHKHNAET